MAIAVETRSIGTVRVTNPATDTFTITAGNSPVVFAVSYNMDQDVTAASWNGVAVDSITFLRSSITPVNTALLLVKNPATGTHTLSITWTTSNAGSLAYMISTTGGNTTTGWRTIYTRRTQGGAGPGTTVTDSVSGDIVFHAATVYGSTITFDGGETVTTTERDNIGGGFFSGGLSTKTAVGSNTAIGATDASAYTEIGVALMSGGATIFAAEVGSFIVSGQPIVTRLGAQTWLRYRR